MNRTEEDVLLDFQPNIIPVGHDEFDIEVVKEQPHPALDTYTADMIIERQDAAKRAKQAKRAAAVEAGDMITSIGGGPSNIFVKDCITLAV